MIPAAAVSEWALSHPWATQTQVEQDLLLSRAICAIAEHPYLGNELVFRGGTALHKLHLPEPLRYSEDLDYVRASPGGIGPLTGALQDVGRDLGFDVKTRISIHPKVYWLGVSETGLPLRLKIEVNTHERSPALPHVRRAHRVHSRWWSGQAEVLTFEPAELVATKIRAIYQRSKGRDLFDLWLALERLGLDPDRILAAAEPYVPPGLTSQTAVANLKGKVGDLKFREDLIPLVTDLPVGYTVDAAADLVIDKILSRLEGGARSAPPRPATAEGH